jgi:HAE1 family hydrophobic/amphiphilic exporter-1
MTICKPFILRPVMTTLLMLPLVVFGIFAFKFLSVSAIPVIESTVIQVSTSYPGASPSEISRLVSGPLEREFMLMQGVQFVSSNNSYETSTIILQFHEGVNIDIAAQQVQNAIDKAQGELPANLPNPPVYTKTNPSDTPILYCVLYSDSVPPWTLYEYGYNFLGQQLGTINGVGNINTFGYPYAVRVKVDSESLAARNISLEDLAFAIDKENADQPTGKFYGPSKSIVNKSKGQLYKAKDYENIIIKYFDNQPVRIKDIAHVEDSLQNDKMIRKWVTKDGQEKAVVALAIYKQQGFNTVQVCQQIEALLSQLKKDLPASIDFEIPFSQAKYILESVKEVEWTLLIAFFLVVAVVYVYLGKLRNSLIPLIALPITITGTFVLMFIFDYSIDIMSMSALTLAIGFLVDDAIVVLENIVRFIEKGDSPLDGSIKGSKQIALTVVSISTCLAIVFVPLLFMQGMIGKIFHEFAAVILIAVIFSAIVSLTLTPMMCSRFIPLYSLEKKTRLEKIVDRVNQYLLSGYEFALIRCLKHPKLVVGCSLLSIIGSIGLFISLPKEFLPENDLGLIQGFLVTDAATSPKKMGTILKDFNRICSQNPFVESFISIGSTPTDNQALFYLNLCSAKKRPSIDVVIQQLNSHILKDMIGVKCYLKAFPLINLQIGSSTSGKANYQYILQSLDDNALNEQAPLFVEALHSRKELAQVSSDLIPSAPSFHIDILRDQVHAYGGMDATAVENALKYVYGETYISKINAPENLYYVILEGKETALRYPDQIKKVYIGDQHKTAIEGVIKARLDLEPVQVNHLNTLSSVTVAFDVAPGYALNQAIKAVEEEAHQFLSSDVIKNLVGSSAEFKKIFTQLTFLIVLAVFVIYIVLGILYENFLQPLTPLSALPIAVFGGLLTLFIFQERLSVYALIGLIMLIGIVMKNGILIVDFALEEMEVSKKQCEEAIVSACLTRFRPIFMTTFAAMMGSIPIALGLGGTVAEGRAPLGMVVVGGLLFSQVVTLFVIPLFFVFNYKIQNLIKQKNLF